MPPRYTIRQVVGTYRRKAFGTLNDDGTPRRPAYSAAAIAAFYGMLELAEEQPQRGHFESERLLRVLLEGPTGAGRAYAKCVPFLIAQGDLVRSETGGLDVEGWTILQEGDATIADRVSRFRLRRRAAANDGGNGAGNASGNGVANGSSPRGTRRARNAVATADGDGYQESGFGLSSPGGSTEASPPKPEPAPVDLFGPTAAVDPL